MEMLGFKGHFFLINSTPQSTWVFKNSYFKNEMSQGGSEKCQKVYHMNGPLKCVCS